MKNRILAIQSGFLAVASASSAQVQALELSLKPATQCKGAGRPAPKMKQTVRTESVGAPATDIDLNGDGWCDWIIPVPYPTNTQLPEYTAGEAILLGTAKGAGTFGDMARLKSHWKKSLPVPPGLVTPDSVTGMAPAIVAYAKDSPLPYFAGFSSSYPEFWSEAGSYRIFRWNPDFNMPQEASKREYASVMKFWQSQYCGKRTYSNQELLHADLTDEERPLEVFVCAPWVSGAMRQAEADSKSRL